MLYSPRFSSLSHILIFIGDTVLLKHLKLSLLIAALALFALACASTNTTVEVRNTNTANTSATPIAAAATAAADELAAARATYNAACVRCHKEDGGGGTIELDEGQTLKVPNLTAENARKDSDEEFAEQITKGGDGMPAFGKRLTPEQISDLVRFIRRDLQGVPPTAGASPLVR